MTTNVGSGNFCGYPADRLGHLRCALNSVFNQRASQANFGLTSYAMLQQNCAASCYTNCAYSCFQAEILTTGLCQGCGPRPGNATTRAGAFIRVPVLVDSQPPPPGNLSSLLAWVDNTCGNSEELFASGATPLNGVLRDMARYFRASWSAPDGSVSYSTPLSINAPEACRSVNVILITDGDESCDTQTDAVNAATDLYQDGAVIGGITYRIRTFVINFAGASQSNMDQIASAGGTAVAYFATNEVQLFQAMLNIIDTSTPAFNNEICGNSVDENCNGCFNESTLQPSAGPDRDICPNVPTVINGSASGGLGTYSYQWSSNGGFLINANQASPTFVAGPGTYQVCVTVTDSIGHCPRQDCATITAQDATPPTIMGCPSDITVAPNAPNCQATVSWTPPTAQDNCSTPSLIGSHAPGATFAFGTTTVTYTATDAANNSTQCNFDVTVAVFPDLNDDGFLTESGDLPLFVNVLLGSDATPLRVYRSDTNCDGSVDGRDTTGFIDALVP